MEEMATRNHGFKVRNKSQIQTLKRVEMEGKTVLGGQRHH
jgi:hypothetical protein